MRHLYCITFTLFMILFNGIAFAEPLASSADTSGNESQPRRAVFVEDQEEGVFHFIIDGQEVARLDSTGLHVRKGISYGGSITDYDPPGFDAHIAQGVKAE